jgi:hypothetical protein
MGQSVRSLPVDAGLGVREYLNKLRLAIGGPGRELFRAESLQERRTLWLKHHPPSLGPYSALLSIAWTVLVLPSASRLVPRSACGQRRR